MHNTNRKKLVVSALMLAILVGAVGYAAIGQAYQIGLNEGLGVNRDSDVPTIHGHLTVWVRRGDSQVWILAFSAHNLITNYGRNATREYLGEANGAAFDYIEVGTGTGGGAGDNALQTPYSTRQQGTYSDTATAYNWTITTTFAAGFFGGETITEAGCFNASTSGTMFNYQDFSGITLSASDSLQVQFEYMVTDAG